LPIRNFDLLHVIIIGTVGVGKTAD